MVGKRGSEKLMKKSVDVGGSWVKFFNNSEVTESFAWAASLLKNERLGFSVA